MIEIHKGKTQVERHLNRMETEKKQRYSLVVERHKQGLTVDEIAADLHIASGTVRHRLKQSGIKPRTRTKVTPPKTNDAEAHWAYADRMWPDDGRRQSEYLCSIWIGRAG